MRAAALILPLAAWAALTWAQAPPSAQRARPAPARSAAPSPVGVPAAAATRPASPPATEASPRLTPVEPGTRDASPLGASLRRLDLDLRVPTGFDRVYAVTPPAALDAGLGLDAGLLVGGSSFSNVGAHWFARMSGGLMALFPRSTYTPTPEGVVTDVPAGTVYFLGTPSVAALARATRGTFLPAGTAAMPRLRVDLSAQRALGAAPVADAPASPDERSLLDDAVYRRRRLTELLSRAQQASHAPEPPRR